MSLSRARSSNSFICKGSMRKRRERSSSWVLSARQTSTTIFISPTSIPTSAPAHSSGYASLACSQMWPTSPRPILSGKRLPLLPEALREVLIRPVAQDGDDHTRLDLPGHLQRRRDRSSGGDADQDSLLARHALDHLVGLLGRGAPVLVGYRGVVDRRHYGALHVLHAFDAVKRRVRLKRDKRYLRVVLLQASGGADESAAGAEARDEVRDLAVRLLPDLRRRRLVVRPGIGRIRVLVRVEVLLRLLGVEPPGLPDGPVGALAGVGQDEVNPVGAQDLLALLARVLRHAQPHPVAQSGPDPGVGDSRVPARRIENSLLRRQSAAPLAVPDHPQRRTVLDRPARVVPLCLAEDAYPGHLGRDARQLQERRVAYQLRYPRPRPLVNPSNHVGIIILGRDFASTRGKEDT